MFVASRMQLGLDQHILLNLSESNQNFPKTTAIAASDPKGYGRYGQVQVPSGKPSLIKLTNTNNKDKRHEATVHATSNDFMFFNSHVTCTTTTKRLHTPQSARPVSPWQCEAHRSDSPCSRTSVSQPACHACFYAPCIPAPNVFPLSLTRVSNPPPTQQRTFRTFVLPPSSRGRAASGRKTRPQPPLASRRRRCKPS